MLPARARRRCDDRAWDRDRGQQLMRGNSASVSILSDENMEKILRNFLQAHLAIRSMRPPLALPVSPARRAPAGGLLAGPLAWGGGSVQACCGLEEKSDLD